MSHKERSGSTLEMCCQRFVSDLSAIECKDNWDSVKSDSLKRDSFSYRICDDLTEVILNWLTIEDKIKFTAVSKQFQRCLLKTRHKQRILKVTSEKTSERNSYHILLQDWSWDKFMDQTFDVHIPRLESILKTFANIDEISFDGYVFIVNKEEVLNKIMQMSSHLSAFSFDFCGTSAPEVKQFAQKFGSNLKRLEFCTSCDVNRVIRFCPNLLSISEVRFNRLFDNKEILVKNLRKALKVYDINDRELFHIFVRNNQNLTHLDIRLSLKTSTDTSDVLRSLSSLENLQILSIQMKDNDSYDKRMSQSLESIALKCEKLKSFELDVEEGQAFDAKHFFTAFKKFSSLKKLSFRSTDNKSMAESLDINCIKNCKKLIHLKLMSDQIDDHFFSQIDSVFPRLQSLRVFLKNELTESALQSMARLQRLDTLIIRRFGGQQLDSITDSSLLPLIEGCHRLHTLFIFNTTAITELTISRLYEKAAKSPGIFYKYYLPSIGSHISVDTKVTTDYHNFNNIYIGEDLKVFNKIRYNFN